MARQKRPRSEGRQPSSFQPELIASEEPAYYGAGIAPARRWGETSSLIAGGLGARICTNRYKECRE